MKRDQIDVIFFDLGGVLVNVNAPAAVIQFAALLGCSVEDAAALWQKLQPINLKYERGGMPTMEWLKHLMKELNFSDRDSLLKVFSDMFSLAHDVVSIAESLAENHTVSLLSNTNPLHYFHIMSRFPELHFFHDPITSYAAQALKPEAEIYRFACRRLQCEPSRALFIDDRLENVQGAEQIGMIALHFTSRNQLRGQLLEMGFQL